MENSSQEKPTADKKKKGNRREKPSTVSEKAYQFSTQKPIVMLCYI